MAISLTKGGNVNLSKEAPNLTNIAVGLGWNPRATDGQAFDLDAIAFLVNESGKVRADTDFIFFNNLKSSDGSVEHTGDNRIGCKRLNGMVLDSFVAVGYCQKII